MAIKSVAWRESPHFNDRPTSTTIDLIIIHAISLPASQFRPDPILDFFSGCLDCETPDYQAFEGIEVSPHFVVSRTGRITQCVPTSKRAWHAGESMWENRCNCNDFSLGIEVIGNESAPFTPLQYRETARLCKALMDLHPHISRQRIVGHQDVAPGRKWDPGKQWDWHYFFRSLLRIRCTDLVLREYNG